MPRAGQATFAVASRHGKAVTPFGLGATDALKQGNFQLTEIAPAATVALSSDHKL